MSKPRKLDLRFLVRMDKSHSAEYGLFRAMIVFIEDGKVRHPSGTWSGSLEAPYADLELTAQCNRLIRDGGNGDNHDWYALEFGYVGGTHAVDLQRAEMMVKTLRRLNAKLVKFEQDTYGMRSNLGLYLAGVAQALGITKFAMSSSYSGEKYGQPKEEDYRWTDINGIQYAMEQEHKRLVGA